MSKTSCWMLVALLLSLLAGAPSAALAGVVCDNDLVCEPGENCNNCPNDCVGGSTSGASCGNGLCEAGNGEDCVSCPADCSGKQNGRPSGRFCCGDGDGQNPVTCSDSRCTTGGFQCTTVPANSVNYCCGDGLCVSATEDQCSCAVDCGTPPANEVPNFTCQDTFDNDCDGATDCADIDCDGIDPTCICQPQNASCTFDSDCCSGKCRGKLGSKSCKSP